MTEQELDEALATIYALLRANGQEEAAELVKTYPAKLIHSDHDSWNGGTDIWAIQIEVPAKVFVALDPGRDVLVNQISAQLRSVVDKPNDSYFVKIVPAKEIRTDWRTSDGEDPLQLFHFLVTASSNVWDDGVEEFGRNRFLEFTDEGIASRFQTITSSTIKQLQAFPCLCTYEGTEDLWVGKITEINLDRHNLRVHVEIDRTLGPIDHAAFFTARKRFGVHEWEFSRTHWAIKHGDLFEKLRKAKLIRDDAVGIPLPEPQEVDEAALPVANDISSLNQFLSAIQAVGRDGVECFYRGHSDEKYRLVPSVFRTDANGVPLYRDSEHEMFREILISNSNDFREDRSTLDRMVRMQHYSLPTRLLDITANPLIALFFAVWSADKRDRPGEVIVLGVNRSMIKYFDSDTASCLANLALMSAKDREQIAFRMMPNPEKNYVPGVDPVEDLKLFNSQTQIERLLHYIGSEKPYFKPRIRPEDLQSVICVKSKRSNDRISSQSGAFLLFGHEVVLNEEGTPDIVVQRFRITNKPQILLELELLNITESTVFPYIENSARDIRRRFQSKSMPTLINETEPVGAANPKS